MDFWTRLGFALALGGIGISIAVFFATYLWHEMPRPVAIMGFLMGILMCAGGAVCFYLLPEQKFPEVTFRFVEPKEPLLQILNLSEATASNILWFMIAFDLDSLSASRQPLPIPATTLEFLKPQGSNLPTNIFGTPLVAARVKDGDRIVGTVAVNCPTCVRGHTFVFSVKLGSGGWYAELPDITNGNIITPADMASIEAYGDEIIQLIPEAKRIPIADYERLPAFKYPPEEPPYSQLPQDSPGKNAQAMSPWQVYSRYWPLIP